MRIFDGERNLPRPFCRGERLNCGFDALRASIRRVVAPRIVTAHQFCSPATHTIPHQLPCPSSSLFLIARLSHKIPQNIPISFNMLPTFHMNNFKPWVSLNRKPFLPQKSPDPCSPKTLNLPRAKSYHNSHSSTLPVPKHHLPAQPLAEVCLHQPCTPLSSQFQPQRISIP